MCRIAYSDAEYNNQSVEVELPDTAVVFLRKHSSLPENGEIVYRKDDQVITCKVPYLQVGNYTLDEFAAKHLYMLFPFYIIRYEHAIKHKVVKKYKLIENEAERVYNILTKAYNDGKLNMQKYEHIVTIL